MTSNEESFRMPTPSLGLTILFDLLYREGDLDWPLSVTQVKTPDRLVFTDYNGGRWEVTVQRQAETDIQADEVLEDFARSVRGIPFPWEEDGYDPSVNIEQKVRRIFLPAFPENRTEH